MQIQKYLLFYTLLYIYYFLKSFYMEDEGIGRSSKGFQYQLVSRRHWLPVQIRVGVPDSDSHHDNYVAFIVIAGSFSSQKKPDYLCSKSGRIWENFLVAHPGRKGSKFRFFVDKCSWRFGKYFSQHPYLQTSRILSDTPAISNFWKPHHIHSWFMETLTPGLDRHTWTWVWPRQNLCVRTIISISSTKIS